MDFTIVGSGIVGLSTAIFLKKRLPNAKVLVIEKGVLPQGASTKNAGFACFGSISEVIYDLKSHSEEEVVQLVQQRWSGIQLLRELLGDKTIDFQNLEGHELFLDSQQELYATCSDRLDEINTLLRPIFGDDPFKRTTNKFGFKKVEPKYITHKYEGQIDTGKMMQALLAKAQSKGVLILNSVTVHGIEETAAGVITVTDKFVLNSKKTFVTTNGFASSLLKENVAPARAQVLVTKPIKSLPIKGTFHFDEGFYYFRNIDGRILFGGGRNLDFKTEKTTSFGQTILVQNKLEQLLKEVVLPNTPFEIDQRWSGIMGVGHQKKPIVKQVSNNIFCGVRMGGMGVAIGSTVGHELANFA